MGVKKRRPALSSASGSSFAYSRSKAAVCRNDPVPMMYLLPYAFVNVVHEKSHGLATSKV